MKVRGVSLIKTVRFIETRFGEDAFRRILENLSEKSASQLHRVILPGGQYDLEIFVELNEVTKKLFDRDGNLWVEMGRFTAESVVNSYPDVFKKRLSSPENTGQLIEVFAISTSLFL